MKKFLVLTCLLTLLTTTGCLVSDRGRHEHYHRHGGYYSQPAVVVGHPVVVVRPPVVVVRPPEVIVR